MYLFKFWSIWDKYSGRHTQISHFGGILPLLTPSFEFMENICGIICLMDPTDVPHFIHLQQMLLSQYIFVTYLRTTLAVPIMCLVKLCFATRVKTV